MEAHDPQEVLLRVRLEVGHSSDGQDQGVHFDLGLGKHRLTIS